jgi:hypothetical protein
MPNARSRGMNDYVELMHAAAWFGKLISAGLIPAGDA